MIIQGQIRVYDERERTRQKREKIIYIWPVQPTKFDVFRSFVIHSLLIIISMSTFIFFFSVIFMEIPWKNIFKINRKFSDFFWTIFRFFDRCRSSTTKNLGAFFNCFVGKCHSRETKGKRVLLFSENWKICFFLLLFFFDQYTIVVKGFLFNVKQEKQEEKKISLHENDFLMDFLLVFFSFHANRFVWEMQTFEWSLSKKVTIVIIFNKLMGTSDSSHQISWCKKRRKRREKRSSLQMTNDFLLFFRLHLISLVDC